MTDMTDKRWAAEVRIMHKYFPYFRPFWTEKGIAGFEGTLLGRSGTTYTVRIAVRESFYPCVVPRVFISPGVRPYIEPDGALSFFCRWRPDRSTFALVTLCALRYLQTYDGADDATSQTEKRND